MHHNCQRTTVSAKHMLFGEKMIALIDRAWAPSSQYSHGIHGINELSTFENFLINCLTKINLTKRASRRTSLTMILDIRTASNSCRSDCVATMLDGASMPSLSI
ncbi:hypothetical protein KIN20_000343 [Parelaphostrongylus tenuis]|uniref:Uncharacterized protein n=1 Tax=Parelaphostrongylus tenuis TaxID=148309 RepID=A0AAD5MB28_PARTN|nr:hypothetical protein KIN20_000343 [Parelaphostrongylus tenuis]